MISLFRMYFTYIQDNWLLSCRLEGAKRDNDFIYHEAEPASTALPEIKGMFYPYIYTTLLMCFFLLLYSSLREVCCCSKQQHRYQFARVFIVLKPFLNCSYSLSTNISTILSRSVACKANSLPTLWSIDGKRYFWETYSHESSRILFFVQVCFMFLLLCDLFFWYV